jgi:HSP20 family protein
MLMRFDPFRELDRLTQTLTSPATAVMAMDAYRHGDEYIVHFDLPGVDASSIEVTVEHNVLSVSAQRRWQPAEDDRIVASERPQGSFSRQLFLGVGLDADRVSAGYHDGVLTVTVPVSERAKPRRVEIAANGHRQAIEAGSTAS